MLLVHPVVKPQRKDNDIMVLMKLCKNKLRDKLSEFGPDETDVRRGLDGRTLRDKLLYDMEMARSGGVRVVFGARYCRHLKMIYRNPIGGFTALKPAKQDLSISRALLRAITATKR